MFLAGLLGVLPRIFVISSENRRLPEAHSQPATPFNKKDSTGSSNYVWIPVFTGMT